MQLQASTFADRNLKPTNNFTVLGASGVKLFRRMSLSITATSLILLLAHSRPLVVFGTPSVAQSVCSCEK